MEADIYHSISNIQRRNERNYNIMHTTKAGTQRPRNDTNFLQQKFIADLTIFILALIDAGHAIVLGLDANETPAEALRQGMPKDDSITMLFENTGLQEVFTTHHGETPDSSTTTPGRFIDRLYTLTRNPHIDAYRPHII